MNGVQMRDGSSVFVNRAIFVIVAVIGFAFVVDLGIRKFLFTQITVIIALRKKCSS